MGEQEHYDQYPYSFCSVGTYILRISLENRPLQFSERLFFFKALAFFSTGTEDFNALAYTISSFV